MLPKILLAHLGLLNTLWKEVMELTITLEDQCAEALSAASGEQLEQRFTSLQSLFFFFSLLSAKILRKISLTILELTFPNAF